MQTNGKMQFSTLTYLENPLSVKIPRKVICQMEELKMELTKYGYLYYYTDNAYIRSLIVDKLIQLTHDLYVLIMKLFHKRGYSFWKNPTLYKTTMCENWKINGRCKFGKKCWYAHGNYELRQQIKFNEYFPFTSENLVYAALSQSGILINPIYELSSIQSKIQCSTPPLDNTSVKKHLANFPPLYPPGTIFWSEYCIRPLCSRDKHLYDERISKYERCDD
uniref:C3H1-type domain-containing protein n=1 Tax=Strongyloides papillosus TaxID=174720 RepID=A0A0N5CBU2_STREA